MAWNWQNYQKYESEGVSSDTVDDEAERKCSGGKENGMKNASDEIKQIKDWKKEKKIRDREKWGKKIKAREEREKKIKDSEKSRFDWKYFLTDAPLEMEKEECDQKPDTDDTTEVLDDIDENGTIKDIEVPFQENQEVNAEVDQLSKEVRKGLKRKKEDLNKDAWALLYGCKTPREDESFSYDPQNYTSCEFCKVRLNVKNVSKHHKKCCIKLGMKKQ